MEAPENHLMVIGDILTEEKMYRQIFWLFCKLEEETTKAGGHVSFMQGIMNRWY